ncbi:PilZ domain-containing protein [Marinicella litoralis]|uniref:PilZ domain-containing protein n=1 Tax=Marinicella litoralis TaxID=644220 RepID=A0A4R6XQV4_9GAMM|nr:PilZ domain-containing protein [Marinicella litoralis]TDR20610.1 PilZ domain-containing protein [Marinicella litoralis]
MTEKRINKRVNPPDGSIVVNQINGKVLGKIIDVSAGGFLLAGREKYSAGMIFQLNLILEVNPQVSLSVGAECIWSDPQTSGLTFGGFQIIDISGQDNQTLNDIIDQIDH